MPKGISFNTGFKDGTQAGTDLGRCLIEKDYLIDVYPQLIDNIKASSLLSWGPNSYGRLGDNSSINKSSPVQTVSGGTNWKQVGQGCVHTAAIKTDGTLWLWGRGTNGRLGDNTFVIRSSPVQTVSSGTNWKQVAPGYAHTAAIKTDGTLWLWGAGSYGRLGNNSTITRSSPVQTVSTGTNWKEVSASQYVSAAIKTDGTLWSWGRGSYGRLGDNSTISRSSPVQTVSTGTNWKQVSVGGAVSAAIKTDGTLWSWGLGYYGRLGDNSGTSKSSPVQTVSSGANWKQVSAGQYTSAAIKTDGTLWLWGRGTCGRLGDNSTIVRSSPVQTVSSGTNWKQVSVGGSHTGAIKTDGTLWMWGRADTGELGSNSTITRSSPVQTVSTGTNWKQVSIANFGVGHTSAIREEGDF
jgi:alpha-tubulin suppressor-like RCC1 family protein